MTANPSRPDRLLKRLFAPMLRRGHRFAGDDRGAVAIEFAILALPFFTIIYAILETTLVFFAGQILDSAVQDASRLLRTGQAQTANYSSSQFRTAICNGLYGMFDCSQLKIKVSKVSNFTSATVSPPTQVGNACSPTTGCAWTITEAYTPGTGGDVILLQVYYKWRTVVNLPGLNLSNQGDGTRLLSSVRVYRNEPFGCTNCS